MKIGINIQGMIGRRVDGGRRYTIELLKVLIPLVHKEGHEVVIFCSDGDDQIISQMALGCKVTPVLPHTNGSFTFEAVRCRLARLNPWSFKSLEWHTGKAQIHFVHSFGLPDYSYSGPVVVTLHCLQHEYFPEFFENAGQRSTSYRRMLSRADIIITNSIFTANSIKQCFGAEFDNKAIIPASLGGGEKIPVPKLDWQHFSKTYNINSPYVIYPSSSLRNKNHQRLLEALSILVHKDKMNVSLVLTGFEKYPRLKWDIERLNLKENVLVLGKLPDDDLFILIKNSICMAFVSLFEGFGLPVVEAMALETPVVCSQVASLPEVGGDAVLYVDPLSVEDITDKLRMMIQDESLRAELSKAGRTQAEKFTWKKCAMETYQAYEQMEHIVFKGE